jgi:hypothetical protein
VQVELEPHPCARYGDNAARQGFLRVTRDTALEPTVVTLRLQRCDRLQTRRDAEPKPASGLREKTAMEATTSAAREQSNNFDARLTHQSRGSLGERHHRQQ